MKPELETQSDAHADAHAAADTQYVLTIKKILLVIKKKKKA